MEVRPTIIDRDVIIEAAKIADTGYKSTPYGFAAHKLFAKIPDISGYVTTRRDRFSPYVTDIMVSSAEATEDGYLDRFGRDLRKEVAAVVEPWFEITRQEGASVSLGTYFNVGETAYPSRSRYPLRNAMSAFKKFASDNNRGNLVTVFNYYVEETPFTPLTEIPANRVGVVPKEVLAGIQLESTNRPMAHAFLAMQRRVAQIPEVRGMVASIVKQRNFLDVVVNNDTNPQEIQQAEAAVIDILNTLEGYLENSTDPSRVQYGGLVRVNAGSSPEDFKNTYIDYAAKNRRRQVIAALFFPK